MPTQQKQLPPDLDGYDHANDPEERTAINWTPIDRQDIAKAWRIEQDMERSDGWLSDGPGFGSTIKGGKEEF
jgi:hypothetical protein